MTISFELEAQLRHDKGKGASRRLRRAEQVPAILYGAGKDSVALIDGRHSPDRCVYRARLFPLLRIEEEALVASVIKCLAAFSETWKVNRAADRETVIVVAQRGLETRFAIQFVDALQSRCLERRARVQGVIAQKLIERTVKII